MHVLFKTFCCRYVQIDFILLWDLLDIGFLLCLSGHLILFLINLLVGLLYAIDETTLKNEFSKYGDILEGCLSNQFGLYFFVAIFLCVFDTSLFWYCIQPESSLIGNPAAQGDLDL